MYAVDSEVEIISGATNLLISKNWPQDLVIFQGYCLQNVEYRDSLPGIDWNIVVVSPAPEYVDSLQPDSPYYTPAIALAYLTIAVATVCILATVFHRNKKIVKLTQPLLSTVILTGILSLGIYCLFLVGHNDNFRCTIRPWLFNLSFTLAFTPLLIKAYKVHLVFNVNPMAKNKSVNSKALLAYTCMSIVTDVLLIALTTYVAADGTKQKSAIETINGAQTEVTYCSTTKNSLFLGVELAFKGLLIGTACVLAFLVRKIAGTIAGSKALLMIVYNVAFCSGFALLIMRNVTVVGLSIIVQIGAISVCGIGTACLLVVPIMVQLYSVGDAAAAEAVLDEVFSPNRGSGQSSNNNNHHHISSVSAAASAGPLTNMLTVPYNRTSSVAVAVPEEGGPRGGVAGTSPPRVRRTQSAGGRYSIDRSSATDGVPAPKAAMSAPMDVVDVESEVCTCVWLYPLK